MELKRFSELGVEASNDNLLGEKIKVGKVLDKEIRVVDYKIKPSKYTEKGTGKNGKCLHLQIFFDDANRVIFSGSANLMNLLEKIPKSDFPFLAKIVKVDERFEFN